LSMVADSNGNNLGSIGTSDIADLNLDRNRNAIDTQVAFLAARSAQGIYVREVDGITINDNPANANFVQRVNLNSTLSPVSNAALEDLRTTSNGPIKLDGLHCRR
jgi:hypothetical protein